MWANFYYWAMDQVYEARLYEKQEEERINREKEKNKEDQDTVEKKESIAE